MYYAFDLEDTKGIEVFSTDNINKVNLKSFKKLTHLESFVESNYSYFGIYNHKDRYTVPVNFNSKEEAQLELIECLNSAGMEIL